MMMDDTKKTADDAAFEDDFDFDDLDEIGDDHLDDLEEDFDDASFEEADLDDEDWDDFDDETQDSETLAAAPPPKQKTFIQKNFNNIVIGIAVIVAIWIFLGQLSGDNANNTPAPQNIEAQLQETEAQPGASDDAIAAFEQDLQSLSLDTESAIDLNEQEEQADPFNLDVMPEAANPQTGDNQETQTATPILEDAPLTPMPEAIFETAATDAAPELQTEPATETQPMTENSIDEMFAEAPVETQITIANEPEAPAEEVQPAIAAVDVSETPEFQTLAEKNSALQAEINALERAVENSQAELQRLSTENFTLEQKAEQAAQEAEKAKEALEVVEIEKTTAIPPRQAQPAAQTTQRSEPAPQRARPAPVQKAREWSLRSAQPGSAMIAEKGSNDLRSVSVGETIPGLGQIQSISVQNGRWVVQGTQNSVFQ